MPTQSPRPPNSCFSEIRSTYRGGLIPIPSQRSRRSGMRIRPLLVFIFSNINSRYTPPSTLSLLWAKQQKAAPSRRMGHGEAADEMARPKGGVAPHAGGVAKAISPWRCGQRCGRIRRTRQYCPCLIHVAPDGTELASGVQVLNWAAVPSTPQRPSRVRLPLRLR